MVPASPRRFSALKVLSPQQTVAEANRQAGSGDRRTVLLVSLDWSRPKDPRTPLGQASLLAALRAADQCDAIGISEPMNQPGFRAEAVVARLLRLAAGQPADQLDVAIGVYVWNDHHVRTLLRQLRQQGCRARIILGGPQISYAGAEPKCWSATALLPCLSHQRPAPNPITKMAAPTQATVGIRLRRGCC